MSELLSRLTDFFDKIYGYDTLRQQAKAQAEALSNNIRESLNQGTVTLDDIHSLDHSKLNKIYINLRDQHGDNISELTNLKDPEKLWVQMEQIAWLNNRFFSQYNRITANDVFNHFQNQNSPLTENSTLQLLK